MLVQNSRENVDLSGIFSVSKGFLNGKNNGKTNDGFSSMLKSLTGVSEVSIPNVQTRAEITDPKPSVSIESKVGSETKADNPSGVNGKENSKELKTESGKETTKAKDTENTSKAEKVSVNEQEAVEDEVSLNTVEVFSVLFVSITAVVSETMNISPIELEAKLNEMGIQLKDLSDFENLKELFSFVKCQGDATKLLTDNNMLAELNELSDKLSELFEGIAPEQLEKVSFVEVQQAVFEKFKLKPEKNVEEPAVKLINDEETEEHVTETASPEGKTVTIEFTKESGAGTHTETRQEKQSGKKELTSQQESFMNGMIKAQETFTARMESLVTPIHDVREIANQILTQVKVNLKPDMQSLEMQLTPEHLGKVKVQLQEANGVLTAKFTTENDVAREAIESNLIHFKETLAEQGIKVDSVEVAVGNFSFDRNDSGNNSEGQEEKHGRKSFSMEEVQETKDSPDLLAQSYFEAGTSTVSYTA